MKTIALLPDRLWDGTADQPALGQAVLVRGRKIEAVCPQGDIPADQEVHWLEGCTLLPGLIDAHVHYSPVMGPAFLAAGVTTIRDVGNDLESILALRESHRRDLAAGPGIVCCGYLLDGPKAYWPAMGRPHTDAAALRAAIRHEVERGVDAIKFYAGMDLELLRSGVEEAHRLGKPTLAHLGEIRAEDAAAAGLDEIQHLTGCGAAWQKSSAAEMDALIDCFLAEKVVMTPTLVVWDRLGRILDLSFAHDTRREWVHPTLLDIWTRYRSRFGPAAGRLRFQEPVPSMKICLARMQERGLTIALGTDTPFPHLFPGFSVHDELALYVDGGIKPVDALRSATSVGARVLGLELSAGRIAPGRPADLVAVRGNPLERIEDIAQVECTFRGGRLFRPRQLLRAARSHYDRQPEEAIFRDLLGYVNGTR